MRPIAINQRALRTAKEELDSAREDLRSALDDLDHPADDFPWRDLIVEGRRVVREGRLLGIEIETVVERARRRLARLMA